MSNSEGLEAVRSALNHSNGLHDRWTWGLNPEMDRLMVLLKADLHTIQTLYGRPLMPGWHPDQRGKELEDRPAPARVPVSEPAAAPAPALKAVNGRRRAAVPVPPEPPPAAPAPRQRRALKG